MRVFYDLIGTRTSPRGGRYFELPVIPKDKINVLVFIHLLAFGLYMAMWYGGLFPEVMDQDTLHYYTRDILAVSSRAQDLIFSWTTGLFTYQFIHRNAGELVLSVMMLWLFGHILQKKIGQLRVVAFYFILVILSAIVFNLSHLLFPIFSGPGGIMEGAFGGVLGVMTTAVYFYGRARLRLGKKLRFSVWQIYFAALLLSLVCVYKNNIAYILVYLSSIWIGFRYARYLAGKHSDKPYIKKQDLAKVPANL
jgi:membrane associated rhomboid family serine protease